MTRYKATVDTPRPPDEVFAYLSDFSTTAEWDPGVLEAERLGDAPVAEGSEFRLVADFLHRRRRSPTPSSSMTRRARSPFAARIRASSRWT